MTEERRITMDDFYDSLLKVGINFTVGGMESIFHPYGIPNSIKDIRNGRVRNLTDFSKYFAEFIGYGAGMAVFVIAPIVKHPENPLSYFWAMTNLVSGAGQFSYRKGKEDGRIEERVLHRDN